MVLLPHDFMAVFKWTHPIYSNNTISTGCRGCAQVGLTCVLFNNISSTVHNGFVLLDPAILSMDIIFAGCDDGHVQMALSYTL